MVRRYDKDRPQNERKTITPLAGLRLGRIA